MAQNKRLHHVLRALDPWPGMPSSSLVPPSLPPRVQDLGHTTSKWTLITTKEENTAQPPPHPLPFLSRSGSWGETTGPHLQRAAGNRSETGVKAGAQRLTTVSMLGSHRARKGCRSLKEVLGCEIDVVIVSWGGILRFIHLTQGLHSQFSTWLDPNMLPLFYLVLVLKPHGWCSGIFPGGAGGPRSALCKASALISVLALLAPTLGCWVFLCFQKSLLAVLGNYMGCRGLKWGQSWLMHARQTCFCCAIAPTPQFTLGLQRHQQGIVDLYSKNLGPGSPGLATEH